MLLVVVAYMTVRVFAGVDTTEFFLLVGCYLGWVGLTTWALAKTCDEYVQQHYPDA
jgi:hypothetical protein